MSSHNMKTDMRQYLLQDCDFPSSLLWSTTIGNGQAENSLKATLHLAGLSLCSATFL